MPSEVSGRAQPRHGEMHLATSQPVGSQDTEVKGELSHVLKTWVDSGW